MKYDVDVAAANATLKTVGTSTEEYQTAGDGMSTALQAAGTAGQSGIIGQALQGYAEKAFVPELQAVSSLTGTAVTQTNQALVYFTEGNHQMMATSVASLKHAEPATGFGGRYATAI